MSYPIPNANESVTDQPMRTSWYQFLYNLWKPIRNLAGVGDGKILFSSNGVIDGATVGSGLKLDRTTNTLISVAGTGSVTDVETTIPGLSFDTPTTTPVLKGIVATAGGGTGLAVPGASGNVLTSDGTKWTSAPVPVSPGGASFVPAQILLHMTDNNQNPLDQRQHQTLAVSTRGNLSPKPSWVSAPSKFGGGSWRFPGSLTGGADAAFVQVFSHGDLTFNNQIQYGSGTGQGAIQSWYLDGWLMLDAIGAAQQTILDSRDPTDAAIQHCGPLYIDSTGALTWSGGVTGGTPISTNAMGPNVWTHFGVGYSAPLDKTYLYLDGVVTATGTGIQPFTFGSRGIRVGALINGSGSIVGNMNEFHLDPTQCPWTGSTYPIPTSPYT